MDSSLGDIIHNLLPRVEAWEQDALEQIKLSVYNGMQLFTIFMTAFFFLFLYYCAFGFVVGSLAESNMEESVTKVNKMPATETNGGNKTVKSEEPGQKVKLEVAHAEEKNG